GPGRPGDRPAAGEEGPVASSDADVAAGVPTDEPEEELV
ncbi:MAG: hypothetical protein QOF81_2733, partial [Acidimicrobiaceae bacterium]|nr:hypothetical protein [Acidimicrobiaceae bacterium]